MGTIRLGKRTENARPSSRTSSPLARLEDLVFGAWDPIPDNAYESCLKCGVLDKHEHVEPIKDFLQGIKPMPAVFDQHYVKRLDGTNVKSGKTKRELAEALREGHPRLQGEEQVRPAGDGLVRLDRDLHRSRARPTRRWRRSRRRWRRTTRPSPRRCCTPTPPLMEGVPFANGAPEPELRLPGAGEAGDATSSVAIGGKDFKTGQTMLKTVLAPMFKARMLGVAGWYSTNILGNRDGEVLDDPESFKTKEESKLGVLEYILQPQLYPELYGNMYHKVRINYYPPRGDNKEGWDNIDIFGWLGYPMQIKVDFLCRDSILAAPLVLDLALFFDLAQRAGLSGIQEWLSFYFKSPQAAPGLYPEHDLFIQLTKLKNTLRWMMGEQAITHLGVEYYEYGEK